MSPTDLFSIFQMAEERSKSVGEILLGTVIPLYQAELVLYNTYKTAMARLEQQNQKGI